MTINITIHDKDLKNISKIAESLSKHGLRVEKILEMSGIIIGTLDKNIKLSVLKIKGVKAVEVSKKVIGLQKG